MRTYLFIFISILLFCRCSTADKKNEQTGDDFIYGFTTEQDLHPDESIVNTTFSLISNITDSLSFSDTAIYLKYGQSIFNYHVMFSSNILSKKGDTLKYADILITNLNHNTDIETKTYVLKGIAKHSGLFEINLYSSMSAFSEQMKNDAPSIAKEYNRKRKIIWDGLIGTLHHGKYYEYKMISAH